jgi:hypothetical protein
MRSQSGVKGNTKIHTPQNDGISGLAAISATQLVGMSRTRAQHPKRPAIGLRPLVQSGVQCA